MPVIITDTAASRVLDVPTGSLGWVVFADAAAMRVGEALTPARIARRALSVGSMRSSAPRCSWPARVGQTFDPWAAAAELPTPSARSVMAQLVVNEERAGRFVFYPLLLGLGEPAVQPLGDGRQAARGFTNWLIYNPETDGSFSALPSSMWVRPRACTDDRPLSYAAYTAVAPDAARRIRKTPNSAAAQLIVFDTHTTELLRQSLRGCRTTVINASADQPRPHTVSVVVMGHADAANGPASVAHCLLITGGVCHGT